MKKETKASRTITFQPTEEVREVLAIALGENAKRGELSYLINQAIRRKLPAVLRELAEEKKKSIEDVKSALTPESVAKGIVDKGIAASKKRNAQ